jgi:aspartyl-tRNA(Asn)/glutamyl-tRNA(Gln) amidotransferase subunit A
MSAEPRTLADLGRQLKSRSLTAEAATEGCLARIAERDRSINAFITVLADEALAQARTADREITGGGYRGPLHGVPVSLKDIIDLRDTPTTAASRVRDGHIARRDATVVERLRDAGAIFIGKTNLHEFALGTTNEDSAYGPVRHPLDDTRSPGGSSGGSAASLLAGMAYASIGTDTGGSVRIPAAACGLVGLKPTIGDIPTDGVVPLSESLDHVGPLCLSVEDTALVYGVLRGIANPEAPSPRDIQGLRFGIPRPYFLDLLDSEIAARFDEACARLTSEGAVLDDVTIAHTKEIGAIYVHVALAEAAAYHAATLESRPHDYNDNVRLRLEMGRYILAEDYLRAQRGREILTQEVTEALAGRDGLLLPSLPVPATRLGVATVSIGGSEETVRNITLRLTQLFNITGHPAISLPCGRTSGGLPAGLQIVGTRNRTLELLQVASAVEKALGDRVAACGVGVQGSCGAAVRLGPGLVDAQRTPRATA